MEIIGSGSLTFRATGKLEDYELKFAIDAAKSGQKVEVFGGTNNPGLDFKINDVPFELATVSKNSYATVLNALGEKVVHPKRIESGANILIDGRTGKLSMGHAKKALANVVEHHAKSSLPAITIYTTTGPLTYVNGKIQ